MSIFTIGLCCYDQFFFLDHYPKENTKGVATDFYESGGGPASNAAYLLGLWGEKVYHCAHLGKDLYADKIIDELNAADVNTSMIIKTEEMLTPLATVLVNTTTGSRTLTVRKMHQPPKLGEIKKFPSTSCNAILIDGHEEEYSLMLIKKFPNTPVIMDAGSVRESTLNLARYTDYMVTSESFALEYIGLDKFNTKQQLYEALIAIKKITKGDVIITLGEKGCVYLSNASLTSNIERQFSSKLGLVKQKINNSASIPIHLIPAYECHIVDSTGAGDIFHAAFTYGVSYGWSLEDIIDFSNKTAALSIEKKGVRPAVPLLPEVEKARLNRNTTVYFN